MNNTNLKNALNVSLLMNFEYKNKHITVDLYFYNI
jgi:hypothetical protein